MVLREKFYRSVRILIKKHSLKITVMGIITEGAGSFVLASNPCSLSISTTSTGEWSGWAR